MSDRRISASLLAAGLVLALAAPVGAQSQAPADEAMADGSIVVTGVEYAFTGIPETVEAGSMLVFQNEGVEMHELAVARIADDTTETVEELMAMGDEAIASGKVEIVGEGPLFAEPGRAAGGALTLDRAGRYVAICFIPQGMDPAALQQFGITQDLPPEEWPPEAQAILQNPPHAALGMVQRFTVTAPDGEEVPEAASVSPGA